MARPINHDRSSNVVEAKSTAKYFFANDRNSAALQAESAKAVTTSATVKSGFFGRVGLQDDWNFLRKLAAGKKKKSAAVYTIGDFEPIVYDCRHHTESSGLLLEKEIIGVFNDDITPGVFRCFQDWKVKLADTIMLLSVVATVCITPLTFIWGGTWGDTQVPGGAGLLVADLLVDIVYAACLAIRLNVSFLHPGRRLEMCNRRKILNKRLKSPSYWAEWISTSTYFWVATAKAPLLLNNWKIVRVGQLLIMPDSLWRLRDNHILLVIRPTALLIFSSHWTACLLACMGGYREKMEAKGADLFRTSMDGNVPPDRFSAYLMAFVEAIYMLTGAMDNPLGDGGPRDQSFGNLLLVAMLGPVGIVIISLVIANVVRMSNLQNALGIRHEETKAFIARALENLDIPKDLQRRVFSLHHFQRLSHDFEAFRELFKKKNLSAPLEIALRIYLYHESFLHSGYFKDKDTNYILEVVRCLEDRVFVPGDYIIRRGEVGCEMFFVGRGQLSIRIPHHLEEHRQDLFKAFVGAEIGKGAYFGEIALVADCLRTAWVCAETYVILSELRRQAIEAIWKYFPEEREILIKTITDNTTKNRKDAMSRLWRNVAKRSVAVKKEIPASAQEELPMAPPSSGKDERATDEMLSCPANNNGTRSAAEELEARYRYAKESADLLEGIRTKPVMEKPEATSGDSIDFGSIMRHFDRCCDQLLRNQNEVSTKMEQLTSDLDELSSRQASLAKHANASAGMRSVMSSIESSNEGSFAPAVPTVRKKWGGGHRRAGSGDKTGTVVATPYTLGLGGILELDDDQPSEESSRSRLRAKDIGDEVMGEKKSSSTLDLLLSQEDLKPVSPRDLKPVSLQKPPESPLVSPRDMLTASTAQPSQSNHSPRQSPEAPEGSSARKPRRVKVWTRRGETTGKSAAPDASEEKEPLRSSHSGILLPDQ